MKVCKVWDEFMVNYAEGNPIWIVTLSNGETIYRDDGRPGLLTHNAWRRLYHYCTEYYLHIVSMTIGFRDNRYALTAKGFCFRVKSDFRPIPCIRHWFNTDNQIQRLHSWYPLSSAEVAPRLGFAPSKAALATIFFIASSVPPAPIRRGAKR